MALLQPDCRQLASHSAVRCGRPGSSIRLMAGPRAGKTCLGASLLLRMGCHCEEKGHVGLARRPSGSSAKCQVTSPNSSLRVPPILREHRSWPPCGSTVAAASGNHDGRYCNLSGAVAATPDRARCGTQAALGCWRKCGLTLAGNPTALKIPRRWQAASGAVADAVGSRDASGARHAHNTKL